jgi:hypothetical protein
MHVCFLFSAALFWWALVHGRYGRLGYGMGVLYAFTTGLHTTALGALMTIAPSPWYAVYRLRSPGFGVDPLADQQLAGLLMWVPFCAVFMIVALARLALSLACTSTVMIAEAVGGWLSGSLALVSDAGHMLTDAAALGLALFAAWLGEAERRVGLTRAASLNPPHGS